MVSRSAVSGIWTGSDRTGYRDAIDNSGAQAALKNCVTKKPNGKGGFDVSYDSTCFHNAMEKAASGLKDQWTE